MEMIRLESLFIMQPNPEFFGAKNPSNNVALINWVSSTKAYYKTILFSQQTFQNAVVTVTYSWLHLT